MARLFQERRSRFSIAGEYAYPRVGDSVDAPPLLGVITDVVKPFESRPYWVVVVQDYATSHTLVIEETTITPALGLGWYEVTIRPNH